MTEMENMKKEAVKRMTQEWDTVQWRREADCKGTLAVYKRYNEEIGEERVCDDMPASVVCRARANTLPLKGRDPHSNKSTECELYGRPLEDLAHFVLHCPKLYEKII